MITHSNSSCVMPSTYDFTFAKGLVSVSTWPSTCLNLSIAADIAFAKESQLVAMSAYLGSLRTTRSSQNKILLPACSSTRDIQCFGSPLTDSGSLARISRYLPSSVWNLSPLPAYSFEHLYSASFFSGSMSRWLIFG